MNKLLKEFLSYILVEAESAASKQAKKMGLKNIAGPYWSQTGESPATHKSEGDKVVLIGKDDQPKIDKPVAGEQPPVVGSKTGQYMGWDKKGAEQPQAPTDATKSSTGATIYNTPIETPAGNTVDAEFKPEDIEKVTSVVNQIIDDRSATDDSLPDQIDMEAHLGRALPESNDEYYKRRKIKNPQSIPDNLRQELKTAGVPDTHIDMIERAINTQTDGDNPPFSEIAGSAVGMGKPPSQAGELMAMTLMAVPRDKRAGVASTVEGLISATGLKTPTLDASWVQAGLNQAEAFDSMMDSRFGQGNWTVEATAWDTREDMDGIGLTPENKGFSTDVAIRIRLKNGEAKVARLSLKKNGEIFLRSSMI